MTVRISCCELFTLCSTHDCLHHRLCFQLIRRSISLYTLPDTGAFATVTFSIIKNAWGQQRVESSELCLTKHPDSSQLHDNESTVWISSTLGTYTKTKPLSFKPCCFITPTTSFTFSFILNELPSHSHSKSQYDPRSTCAWTAEVEWAVAAAARALLLSLSSMWCN